MLPDWSPPSGHYSFHCRQEAWELLRQSDSNWERSVPDVADATRSPDPSTVRRWAGRLMRSGNPAGGEALAGYPLERLDFTHHPCLGLDGDPPYSAVGGEKSVSRKALDELKQQIPLLDYLEAHDWRPVCPNPSRIISAKTSLPLQPDAELRCSGGAARIPRGKDTGIGYRSRVIGMIEHVEEVHVESQTDFLGDADKLERRRILEP